MKPTGDQTVRSMTETIGRPTRLREPEEPLPHIPDYHFVKVIGRGAFGTVWLAEETMAGVYRAIKVLRPRRIRASRDAPNGNAPSVKERRPSLVDRELDGIHAYQVLAKDHPHLIRILKSGLCKIADDTPLSPPLARGEATEELVQGSPPLARGDAGGSRTRIAVTDGGSEHTAV